MNKFSDFNIGYESKFVGPKVDAKRFFDKEIFVDGYKINESRFKKRGDEKYMLIQVEFEEKKYVIQTESSGLMNQIKRVPEDGFPFIAKIKNNSGAYYFE